MLRDVIPPCGMQMIKRIRDCSRRFPSYADAARACEQLQRDDLTAQGIAAKTRNYVHAIERDRFVCDFLAIKTGYVLHWAKCGEVLHVLDFGGGCGVHYYTARRLVGSRLKMKWVVVETESMVKAAGAMGCVPDDLLFCNKLEDAKKILGKIDLVYTSGALMCVPDTYAYLQMLVDCGAEKMFLTRNGLTLSGKEIFTIRRFTLAAYGPGPLPKSIADTEVCNPITYVAKSRFEEILSNNYRIDMMMREDENVSYADSSPIHMYGYYCTRLS